MSRSVIQINFLRKRNQLFRNFKPLPCVWSQERYFSTTNDNDGNDQKPKGTSEKRTSNTNASETTESGSASEKIAKEDTISKKAAAGKKKLFSLLSEFEVEPSNTKKVASNLNLAKAVKRLSKEERFKDLKSKTLTPKEKLQMAVNNVAENISGDPEQTKLELNEKLSSLKLVDSPKVEEANAKDIISEVDEEMKENIMSSVKDVASTITDSKVTAAVKSKLTQRLLRLSLEDKSASLPKKSMDTLLKGMKIEKKESEKPKERQKISDKVEYSRRTMQRPRAAVNIFQSPPLDIFSLGMESKIDSKKTVWTSLEEKNLRHLVQFAPANGFEEMILWTEQGKHWTFPIDNETEMGNEENVGFHEHVFLEQHLHGFPTKGPVRQFMEHVIVGLSKNPYITVERKIENIDWFRNYFKEKEELLQHYGALG